ncbi:MAG: hypothetical protein V6Z81_10870 [Parvularculales bacterium]
MLDLGALSEALSAGGDGAMIFVAYVLYQQNKRLNMHGKHIARNRRMIRDIVLRIAPNKTHFK